MLHSSKCTKHHIISYLILKTDIHSLFEFSNIKISIVWIFHVFILILLIILQNYDIIK